MARHRSDAPLAPRHAPNVPVDPYGDPVDVPRGGVAAPPSALPGLPEVDPAPWTGPTGRPVPPPRTGLDPGWSPAVPVPRAEGGRHSWIVEPDGEAAAPVPRASPPAERPGTRERTAPRGTGGHDPETTPLDLAAIALACANSATGSHRFGGTGGIPSLTGGSGPLTVPAPPTTGGHRFAGGRGGPRGLSPTRTAGALAVAGALVSAGVAVLSSGSMLASAESPRTAAEASATTPHDAPGR